MDTPITQSGLFGNQPAVISPALAQLAQLLQGIQRPGQQPNQTPTAQAQAPSSGGYSPNGNTSGMNIPGMLGSASNLQSLPWLSPAQNAASMGSALLQGGGNNLGASALSFLAGL